MTQAGRKLSLGFFALLAVSFLILLFSPCHKSEAGKRGEPATCTVSFVPDGDTVICEGGFSVRYIGINAPEMGKDAIPEEPFASRSLEANRALAARGPLRLVYDKEKQDRYGRTLCYVYNSEGVFVNGALMEKGLAYVLPVSPNLGKQEELLALQQKAMQEKTGLWGAYEETMKAPFIGNPKSWRFHKPRHYKPKAGRPEFSSAWDAFYAGYAPCRECFRNMAKYFFPHAQKK